MHAVAFTFGVLALGGGDWAPPSADELLRRAGVERLDVDKRLREQLRVPGLADVEWRSTDPRIEFQTVPFSRSRVLYPDGDAHAPDAAWWGKQLAKPVFAGPEPELLLVADASGLFARGALTLRPDTQSRGGADATLQVLGVTTGCSMRTLTQFPIALTDAPVTFSFEWDLRSPVSLQGRRLLIDNDFGDAPSYAIRVVDNDPLVELAPRSLRLASDEPADLDVRTRPDSQLRLVRVTHPACLELVARESAAQSTKLSFRETELARHFHRCSSVDLELNVDGNPEPFHRRAAVVHERPMRDPDGRPIVCAAVAPGETVELWAGPGVRRLSYPDRLECSATLLANQGLRRVGSAQVPVSGGHAELVIGDGEQSVRLMGVAFDGAMREFQAWKMGCGR